VSEHQDFDASVGEMLVVLVDAKGGAISSNDVAAATLGLSRFLVARFPGLQDPDDTASEALARFVEAAQQGRIDPALQPAAYLTRIARNAAIDRLRHEAHIVATPQPTAASPIADDDSIVRLLDSDATCQLVSEGIRAANQAGDHTVVRIITQWIDMAQSLSRAPTSREVGDQAGVSHTTVRAALTRFRSYLPKHAAHP
jgi:DNA-directed RNA polymerase specialized sigma24 family protein